MHPYGISRQTPKRATAASFELMLTATGIARAGSIGTLILKPEGSRFRLYAAVRYAV